MSDPRVITLGCRLNAYESEVMRRQASEAGVENALIINTCAVTGEAVRQAMQAIRKARRENPEATIVVTGCAAQTEPDRFAAMPEVDRVLGNGEKTRPDVWSGLALSSGERVQVDDIMSVRETAGHLIDGFGNRTRAYVQVQNGCDHRCTFCIIPFGRGPSRSVPAGEVVAQIRRLADAGTNEVVLTGVDLTSYGGDLPGTPRLGRLVRQILTHVPQLPRLRLSSIDQVEVDDDLMQALAEESRLMPHLHLSLQAGDDMILKRMKRRHLRDDAIRFCEMAKRLRPDLVFGADLIAGFPTETDAMFEQSLRLVDECELTYLHVFPYSPRKGTPAARMPQVPRSLAKERAQQLRERGDGRLAQHLAALVGQIRPILIERDDVGRAPDFTEWTVRSNGDMPREGIVMARAIDHDGRRVLSEVVE